jgi:hypothetical protein
MASSVKARICPVGPDRSEQAGVVAQQLRLFLQRVLRGLQPAKHHEVDDAVDLVVGQLAIQRAIVNLRQRADHVVLRVASLAGDEVGEVLGKAFQPFCLLGLLIRVELVGMAAAIHVLHDLRAAPAARRGYPQRHAEDVGGHDLRQRAREFLYELHRALAVAVVARDPAIDQFIDHARDHCGVAFGARSHPRIGEFLAMGPPQFKRGAQRTHRFQREVEARGIARWLLAALQQRLQLRNHQAHHRGVALRVLDHALDILVAGEHERIAGAVMPSPGSTSTGASRCRIGYASYQCSWAPGPNKSTSARATGQGRGLEAMIGRLLRHRQGSVGETGS